MCGHRVQNGIVATCVAEHLDTVAADQFDVVRTATALVATACLVTAILVPILTAMWVRRKGQAQPASDVSSIGEPQPIGHEGHI